MAEIRFVKADSLKEKPDVSKIGFGTHFTDYMFEMDYTEKDGWHDARIIPYGDIAVSPANTTLHYGQAVFEGLKAYRQGGDFPPENAPGAHGKFLPSAGYPRVPVGDGT